MSDEEFEAMTTPAERAEMLRDEKRNFFTITSRAIVEHLRRTYKPTEEQLAYWLKHPAEIDARVIGSEFENVLSHHPNVAVQRAGILSMLAAKR